MECRGALTGLSLNYKTRRTEATLEVDAKPEALEELQGKELTICIKRYRKKRSLDANGYYWQLITQLANKLNASKDELHNLMLRRYGQLMIVDGQAVYTVLPDTEEAEKAILRAETYHLKPTSQVKQGKGGKTYRTYMMLKGSSEYDTAEMSALIDGLVSECKEQGIETLTSEAIRRMMDSWKV